MTVDDPRLAAARAGDGDAFASLIAPYRRELRAHCYRFSGSLHDADDLLQDSLVRAWRGLSTFEARSSLRVWLYRVATNTCLDAVDYRRARLLPEDLADTSDPAWLEPCPASWYADLPMSPEARFSASESVTLAFLVALQTLPARQRAVLILRDVVGLDAAECADLLEMSVPAVNSALQRARDTVAKRRGEPLDDTAPPSLLARYVDAWHLADVGALVALPKDDATLAMPPMSAWFAGADAIGGLLGAQVLTADAVDRYRLLPIAVSGGPGFAVYRLGPDGAYHAAAIHVLDVREGKITGIMAFLGGELFSRFGLADVCGPSQPA